MRRLVNDCLVLMWCGWISVVAWLLALKAWR